MFLSSRHLLTSLLLTSSIAFSSGPCIGAEKNTIDYLDVEDAWIAEAPPVSKVMVAYMNLSNRSDEAQQIVSATSDNYSSIEFHETVYEDGLARMIRHETLTLPGKSTVKLQRGGKHLMLFNPVKHLKAGDTITIRFTDTRGDNLSVAIPVRKSTF